MSFPSSMLEAPLLSPLSLKAPAQMASFGRSVGGWRGFTLVELLVVIAIIVVMTMLVVPALAPSKGAAFTKAVYDISGILESARSYAVVNNTYAYVGITEVDVSKPSAQKPQIAGVGRLAVAVVASPSGMRGYDFSAGNARSSWESNYLRPDGVRLVPVNKLYYFDNLHLAATLPLPPQGATSGMSRNAIKDKKYILGDPSCVAVTPFTWPVGAALATGYQYRFDKVICFDPQGIPRIQFDTNADATIGYMEIDLQQTHGNADPGDSDGKTGSIAAIQIDGLTGAVRLFRP